MAATDSMALCLEAFERTAARPGEPAWLSGRRRLGIERFSLLGFPTTRDEEYKYTNLAKLAKLPLRSAEERAEADAAALALADYEGLEAATLVFVDGRYRAELSDVAGLAAGAVAAPLAEAPAEDLEGHLTRYADVESHALTALNTALFEDAAFVKIPAKTVLEKPVHVIWVATGQANAMTHPRLLILAGRESQGRVVESFVSTGGEPHWTNAVAEIVAEEAAQIEHYKVQQESPAAFHTGAMEMLAERNATVLSMSLSFGGGLTRNDIGIVLDGEGGHCALDGLYVAAGGQHVDHHTRIDHAKPHCTSHQIYKGILDGSARGVFNGKIIVRKDAQKTDAIQNNKNLLLSAKAEIDTKPQLEIDANDVRCTHGATVGQLDKDALFYLRSRGIPYDAARGLLTYAFAAEVLERVSVEAVRDHFERILMRSFSRDPKAEEERR